jgi:hypothetical protein
MATTAGIQLTSSLLSNAMSVNTSTSCMKAGTTADSLDQMETGYIEIASGTNYDLLRADGLPAGNEDKSNKVYICNESTDETYYVVVTIKAHVVGRLYAGDWMFIPWIAADATSDIEIQGYVGTNKITYTYFHEGKTLFEEGDTV